MTSPDERFELAVNAHGFLPIPQTLRRALRLESGEIVALERWPGSLHLEPFSSFVDLLQGFSPGELRAQALRQFHCRELSAVEEKGLPIPAALFPLQEGDRVVLQALYLGRFPELYLYPAETA
ncbi:MAG TPA: hypothetical protein VIE43_22160 [Thermoanaerobaculia bacterium]|jgi:bifunctional DNA-binding transcriptional regulator/antitoxin component of YhaV-PrlF toxin-antitoxin module|nr:hypothetical protein [Thermoanaerobaculia bacterium]